MLNKILNFLSINRRNDEESKFIVTYGDCVETGYLCHNSKTLGGTIDVAVEFEIPLSLLDLTLGLDKMTLDAIDALDHSTISDDIDVTDFSERYFVINNNKFEFDACLIVYNILKNQLQTNRPILMNSIKSISVKFNKTEVKLDSELLEIKSNIIIQSYAK